MDKGKVCKVIIYGGSCENMIATNTVEKLFLDDVWCEVIVMESYHLLLVRPCQYDRKTKTDGFQNIYSFKKHDTRITMLRLMSLSWQKIISYSWGMKMQALLRKKHDLLFTLVVQDIKRVELTIPFEVQPLITEFHDVFPHDIPTRLTIMCNARVSRLDINIDIIV